MIRRPPGKELPREAQEATPCSVADLEPGDFVQVGGAFKQVRRVVGGADIKTVDGSYYGPWNIQKALKRKREP